MLCLYKERKLKLPEKNLPQVVRLLSSVSDIVDDSSGEGGGISFDLSGHGAPMSACNPSSSSEKHNKIYVNIRKTLEVELA